MSNIVKVKSEETKKMERILQLLSVGRINIPKKIWKLDDVYTETKIMFSTILSEKEEYINSHDAFPLSEVIEIYENVQVEEIMLECFCGEPMAKLIKEEMIEIAKNIEEYLDVPIELRSKGCAK